MPEIETESKMLQKVQKLNYRIQNKQQKVIKATKMSLNCIVITG